MEWDKGMIVYIHRTAAKNYWRVIQSSYEIDDLIQEGYLALVDTERRYPLATEKAHFMALFKLVYRSRIENIVRKCARQVDDPRSDLLNSYAFQDKSEVVEEELATITTLMQQAPPYIKKVLNLLTTEEGCKKLQSAYHKDATGRRELTNERLCRLIGVDPSINVAAAFQSYFA